MSEYDWHQVVPLRWSATGNLQQQFKRRVSNSRGVWYDEYEWRDVPIEQPAQETSPAPQRMRISYQPQGNCLWHLDCTVANGSGIMSVMAHEDSRSLLECGHCKQRGYYPKGAVGAVCVDVVSAANR